MGNTTLPEWSTFKCELDGHLQAYLLPQPDPCSICGIQYDTELPIPLPCPAGHVFGYDCITTWFRTEFISGQSQNTCPLCRAMLFRPDDRSLKSEDGGIFLTVAGFPFDEYRQMVIHAFRVTNTTNAHDERWNMQFRPLADAVVSMLESSTSWNQVVDGLLRLQPHIRQRLALSRDDHENANTDPSSFATVPDIWLELFDVLIRLSLASNIDEPAVSRGESTTSEDSNDEDDNFDSDAEQNAEISHPAVAAMISRMLGWLTSPNPALALRFHVGQLAFESEHGQRRSLRGLRLTTILVAADAAAHLFVATRAVSNAMTPHASRRHNYDPAGLGERFSTLYHRHRDELLGLMGSENILRAVEEHVTTAINDRERQINTRGLRPLELYDSDLISADAFPSSNFYRLWDAVKEFGDANVGVTISHRRWRRQVEPRLKYHALIAAVGMADTF